MKKLTQKQLDKISNAATALREFAEVTANTMNGNGAYIGDSAEDVHGLLPVIAAGPKKNYKAARKALWDVEQSLGLLEQTAREIENWCDDQN